MAIPASELPPATPSTVSPECSRSFEGDVARIDAALQAVSPAYVGWQTVQLPPTWKDAQPARYTMAAFAREPSSAELLNFFAEATRLGLSNPRPISQPLLRLASLFHPLFYASFTAPSPRTRQSERLRSFAAELPGCRLVMQPQSDLRIPTVLYYLQSLLFLAGCTLTAAIVQRRFSEATILSKLNRLWQGAQLANRFGFDTLKAIHLEDFVVTCDTAAASACDRLIAIKRVYGQTWRCLGDASIGEKQVVTATELSVTERGRFGFVASLRHLLGPNLRGIVVYGSAVTSQTFSDYDLILVVDRAEPALRTLAGTSPAHNGIEMNLSIYDHDDFLAFQALSGDNLNHNARCIFGEVELLIKPAPDLMLRNVSFAFVRLRQLLGMAGYLAKYKSHPDLEEQANLYQYLVKIPMHIMKGVRSVAREPIAKEYLNAWIRMELGYDVTEQHRLVATGRADEAIANAYLATQDVISHFNERYRIFEEVAQPKADLWTQMEALPGAVAVREDRDENFSAV